jgi:hypothetical protein
LTIIAANLNISASVMHMTWPTTMRFRRTSWFLAVIFFMAFTYVGLCADELALRFKDVESLLSGFARLMAAHGLMAFPVLGVFAAISFLLSDRSVHRIWIQWVLITLYSSVLFWGLYAILDPHGVVKPLRSP